jgi:enoyl-[acyl-carrier protein] reductase III
MSPATRAALVTGGSGDIGRAICLDLARDGCDIAFTYFRDSDAAEETRLGVEAQGRRAVVLRAHLGDPETPARIVAEATGALGPLDICVLNAASGVIRPVTELDAKHVDWTLAVNARSALLLGAAAAEVMPEGGAIVALTSLGSTRVLPGYAAVGASKAALEAVVRYLAVELAPRGIRVNAVSPGVVDTGALKHFPAREEMLRDAKQDTPAGRMVTPEDVAAAVRFLVSADAWMIRGHTLVVDGGYSLPA